MIFYAPNIESSPYVLSEEESAHITRVMRLKVGDPIILVDGRGGYYDAVIVGLHPKRCEVEIKQMQQEYGKRPYRLHIAIAPTKNIDRFEWFVEKAVEIGIEEITPLLCIHSERKTINEERLQRIAVSAMKQSQKAYMPILHPVTRFDQFIQQAKQGSRYIAYCLEGEKSSLSDLYKAGEDAVILIGPEGDFSVEEIEMALQSGFEGITLGNSRMRTETAGVVVCHSIYFMNGNR